MISEIFLKRALSIKKKYLHVQKLTSEYEIKVKEMLKFMENSSKDADIFLERLNGNFFNDPEKAKDQLLSLFINIEDEYNKTTKKITSVEEEMDKLKKEEEELYRDIRQRYPEFTDKKIKEVIHRYISKQNLT